MSNKTVFHAPATAATVVVAPTMTGSVTVTQSASNTARVFVSTNPLVCVYPWYGTAMLPGTTASFTVAPGGTLYSHSPSAPASASVTVA